MIDSLKKKVGENISVICLLLLYWIMHAQYSALFELNLKLQFGAVASFSLLLILLDSNSNFAALMMRRRLSILRTPE